eukprot:m.250927 g.250927  ORF g.250927 m.250927 type:complete len:193 (+) comp85951_c0_seq1:168-746(+)
MRGVGFAGHFSAVFTQCKARSKFNLMAASSQQQQQQQLQQHQQQQGGLAPRSFFDDAFSFPWFGGRDLSNIFQNEAPMLGACDIVETADAYVVKADTPGLTASDIKVQLTDDHTLRISGERKREHEEKTDKYHRVERSHGRFTRSFALPENADVSKIAATVDHGVCRVSIGKRTETRPKVTDVPVGSASAGK